MKFIKVIIDGKEYYKRIDDEQPDNTGSVCDEEKGESAKKTADSENAAEPEIIDAEIKDGEEPSGAEKFKRDTADFFEKMGTGAKDLGEKIKFGAKELGIKISGGAKSFGTKIKEGTERLFSKDKSTDNGSTEAKLLKLLPYMSKEDAHEVCEKLISNDEALKNLDLATIMPFLTAEDCNALFVACIKANNTDYDLVKAMRYVSPECLTGIVDGYIAGEYPELDIDEFYPFLSDADIKRIFYHILENNE